MNNHDKIKQAFSGLKAPDDIAEKVIKNAMGETPKRTRRPYNIGKVVLVAIALFILTTTTVLAAVLSGIIKIGVPYWEEYSVGVETAGVYPISENLRRHINNNDLWEIQTWGENNEYKYMNSMGLNAPVLSSTDEAAVFYGVPFSENPMLNEYVRSVKTDPEGNIISSDEYLVRSYIGYYKEEEIETADISLFTMNKLDTGEQIAIHYRFFCGTNMNANAGSSTMYAYVKNGTNIETDVPIASENYVKIDEESSKIENYISPVNNIEAILYTVYRDINSSIYSCHAVFALNGISYNMTVFSADINFEQYSNPYDIFKTIIDAYIFE